MVLILYATNFLTSMSYFLRITNILKTLLTINSEELEQASKVHTKKNAHAFEIEHKSTVVSLVGLSMCFMIHWTPVRQCCYNFLPFIFS